MTDKKYTPTTHADFVSEIRAAGAVVAYVAGPYRAETHAEVHANIQRARRVAEQLWAKGYAVICPHLNSAFMSGPIDEKNFLDGYLELVRRSDIVVLTTDIAGISGTGTQKEYELARELGIPVVSHNGIPPAEEVTRRVWGKYPERCGKENE